MSDATDEFATISEEDAERLLSLVMDGVEDILDEQVAEMETHAREAKQAEQRLSELLDSVSDSDYRDVSQPEASDVSNLRGFQ